MILDMNPACSVEIMYQMELHWRKVIFLSQQVSIADSFFLMLGILYSLFPLSAGTLSGLDLYPLCTARVSVSL